MPPVFLGFLLLLVLGSSCATAFHSYEDTVLLRSDDPDSLLNASVWVNGRPGKVKTLKLSEKSERGWGEYLAVNNQDPYLMGPGLGQIRIERSISRREQIIVVRKDGFRDQRFVLHRHASGYFYLNILNGIGFLVDLYSGFMWNYEPDTLELKFVAEKS